MSGFCDVDGRREAIGVDGKVAVPEASVPVLYSDPAVPVTAG
jgi:hypothetical protein